VGAIEEFDLTVFGVAISPVKRQQLFADLLDACRAE
jgi:hypothetical protein